jgi:hypothetical protein
MFALREYQREHPAENIYLAYVGEVDPAFYGIRYTRLGESDHPAGTVIVSATHLSGQLLKDHRAYRWLLPYPRKAILNHTLHVFDTAGTPSINSANGGGTVAKRTLETDVRVARQ